MLACSSRHTKNETLQHYEVGLMSVNYYTVSPFRYNNPISLKSKLGVKHAFLSNRPVKNYMMKTKSRVKLILLCFIEIIEGLKLKVRNKRRWKKVTI